jgi:hypothetical protein
MRDEPATWSKRAEEIVSRLIATLPPDPSDTHITRLNALSICCSLWAGYYLRANGDVIVVGADCDAPDVDTIFTDRMHRLSQIVIGSRRYPELLELIPDRPSEATGCECLKYPHLFGPEKICCQICGGVGWLPLD